MIPYEELVEALDRYVARNGGTPQSARASASQSAPSSPSFAPPPAVEAHHDEVPAHDIELPSFDEHHDPDMPGIGAHGGEEDATHVGSMPGTGPLPPPLEPVHHDESNEIDI